MDSRSSRFMMSAFGLHPAAKIMDSDGLRLAGFIAEVRPSKDFL
jgi:hypothetical protein